MTAAPAHPMGEFSPGAVVGGYVVVRLLGRGAMGTVYEARNPQIDKRVALKVLDGRLLASREMMARFQNEARAASRIEHPGIVNVFDFNRLPDGTAFLVMEYLDGVALSAAIHRARGPLPDALRLSRQMALALQAAHERGIVHRDLKPGNVMLVADPEVPGLRRVKVVDFGIAKLVAGEDGAVVTTRSDAVMGTPAYMSPEQCRGAGAVSDRADVYSLGVMLHEMLVGERPFVAQTQVEMMYQQMNAEPESLARRRPELPAALHALVRQMLAKAAAGRPSMAEVARALQEIGEGQAGGSWAPAGSESILEVAAEDATERSDSGAIGDREPVGTGGGVAVVAPNSEGARSVGSRAGAAPGGRGVVAGIGIALALGLAVVVWRLSAPGPALAPMSPLPGPAAPKAAGAARHTVRWSIDTEPAGIEVVIAGRVVGTTPWRSERPAQSGQVEVTLRQRGYVSKTVTLDGSENTRITEILRPEHRPAIRRLPANSRPEAKPEAKPDPKPEPKPESKPESKIEIMPLDRGLIERR